jgi:hypothetical protein
MYLHSGKRLGRVVASKHMDRNKQDYNSEKREDSLHIVPLVRVDGLTTKRVSKSWKSNRNPE